MANYFVSWKKIQSQPIFKIGLIFGCLEKAKPGNPGHLQEVGSWKNDFAASG